MADEAFALSPISARAELPSEADYDAIREAFMETARGRWFLGEYGKRNRNADTTMVLDAVARIEATIAAAHKPAPSNELPDALVLIRGLLSDARASAAQTMSGPDAELALAAVNKAVRIIREIAWTLREYGTDTRICDMLDAQVNGIETSHQHTIATEKRDAVLATFDLLIRRIGELGGSADAEASHDVGKASPPRRDPSNAATTEAGEARTPSFDITSAAAAEVTIEVATKPDEIDVIAQDTAVQDATAQDTTLEDTTLEDRTALDGAAQAATLQEATALDTTDQDTTSQDTTAQDTTTQGARDQDALDRDTQDQDALADETLAQETSAQETSAQDTIAYEAPEVTPPFSESSEAAMMIASAEAAPARLPEPEAVTEADAEAAALDLEIAQDMAVLDAIALEMAEPGVVREEPAVSEPAPSEPAVSELAPAAVPEFATAEPDVSEPDVAETELVDTRLGETTLAEPPRITGPDRGERGMVESAPAESVTIEPDSVALASAIFTTQKPEQPSLGATLIANGILSGRTAANDALTPFRRMSQAERIAFFS